MKKIAKLLMAFTVALSVAGCGTDDGVSPGVVSRMCYDRDLGVKDVQLTMYSQFADEWLAEACISYLFGECIQVDDAYTIRRRVCVENVTYEYE